MAETTRKSDLRQPRGSVKPAELAEVSAGWERPLGSDPRDPVPFDEPAEYADHDTLVPRADVATDGQSYVFVAAGDRLPTRAQVGTADPIPAGATPAGRAKVRKPKV